MARACIPQVLMAAGSGNQVIRSLDSHRGSLYLYGGRYGEQRANKADQRYLQPINARRRVQVPSNQNEAVLVGQDDTWRVPPPAHVASASCSSLNLGAFFCASFLSSLGLLIQPFFSLLSPQSLSRHSFPSASPRCNFFFFLFHFSSGCFVIGARGAHETLVGGHCMSAFFPPSPCFWLVIMGFHPNKASSRV